jgi:hypothetical protein
MTKIRKPLASIGALLIGALGACQAEEPGPGVYDKGPQKDAILWPDAPQGCPPPSSLTLTLDSYTDPTCYALMPFRGTATGADRVVAQGGANAAQPAVVGSDGRFCIEVELQPSTQNTIIFSPVDVNGCPGQNLTKTITHQSCAGADAGAPAVINVAQGKSVVTDASPSEGQNPYLTDGKTSTVVAYTGGWGWTDANIWVGVALGQPVLIEKIVVRWRDSDGNGCDYGGKYKIAISAFSSPGKMDLNSGDWTQLEDITDGDGGDDSYSYASSKPLAQHVALLLKTNGCTGWSETFAIAELEVYAQDPSSPTVPPPEGCL